jgi:hypothetical protein
MENEGIQPTNQKIMQIGTGCWASKILLSAVKFELFTLLEENTHMSAMDIKLSLKLNCTDRHVYDYLDSLTGFGFLIREGILERAQYSNATDAAFYLDKKKPSYIGGMLEIINARSYRFWGTLEEGLRTGLPQNEFQEAGSHSYETLYESSERLHDLSLVEFANSMGALQNPIFKAFVEKFDFTNYKTLTDVGGASGLLSVMVAEHQPHMTCTTFDLPPMEPIAAATIEQFQLGDRVKAVSGDFFVDDIPAADVVVMGNILHYWDEEKKLTLMKKAHDTLPEGGAFVAIEGVIDNDRKENVGGLVMSLNMMIETGSGFDYTFDDFNKWAKIVGFKSTSLLPLCSMSAAVAYK